jgi:hypothetical protein
VFSGCTAELEVVRGEGSRDKDKEVKLDEIR